MSKKRKAPPAGKERVPKVAANPPSRKEKRKEQRKQKKQKKFLYFQKKSSVPMKQDLVEVKEEAVSRLEDSEKRQKQQQQQSELKLDKLKKEQSRQRRKLLLKANLEEDKNLKKLEKQLKLNKRKKAGLPKSFIEDGLDFLLDVCGGGDSAPWQDEEEEVESREKPMGGGENSDESDDEDIEEEEDKEDNKGEEDDEDNEEEEDGDHEEDSGDDETDNEEEMDKDSDDAVEEAQEPKEEEVWEDIYGVTRNSRGIPIPSATTSKYVPPALRAKMVGSDNEKRKAALTRLQNKLKGLLNRLASSNLGGIARQMEDLYASNSRNDMNECILKLLSESLISPTKTPERLIMEHALLIGLLHINVGIEVGATILQAIVKSFHEMYLQSEVDENNKKLDNGILFIISLYNFKVVDCPTIFDLVDMMVSNFQAKDIELILLTLRSAGFLLRKDDPRKFKELIINIQKKCQELKHLEGDSRVKFMLEVLLAIKNNNVKKIPNYDAEHQQFLLNSMKQWLRPGNSPNPLKVPLKDLLNADVRGRWWIVGSAWAGKKDATEEMEDDSAAAAVTREASYSSEILELARKMRMNTAARKDIFCTLMSAEDYLDAFEKLLKLHVKHQREREVMFVLLDCCLQEKRFNPYYSQLAAKFASFERKYRLAVQFGLWDKIKELNSLQRFQWGNLAEFVCCLINEGSLSLACLKVIEFADLDKARVSFLKQVLMLILAGDTKKVQGVFGAIAGFPKLKLLREGLRLFMRQFLLKKGKEEKVQSLKPKVIIAESAMMAT